MPDRIEQLRQRLLATFKLEADEHLHAIAEELESLRNNEEAGGDVAARVRKLFQVMHTLKGAARSVGHAEVEEVCQHCELLLRDLTRGHGTFDGDVLNVLQDASDLVANLIGGTASKERVLQVIGQIRAIAKQSGLQAPVAPGAKAVPKPVAQPEIISEPVPMPAPSISSSPPQPVLTVAPTASDRIRVEISRLDGLVVLAEDFLLHKLASAEHARTAREIAKDIILLRTDLRGKRTSADKNSRSAFLADLDTRLRGVETAQRKLASALVTDHKVLRTAVDDLVEETRRLRMMPAGSILEAFPGMVRDLCRETGKMVAWQASGTELDIDRKVLDLVKDPLIHMVRNAIDHGIELPAEREAAGKAREGKVSVRIAPAEGGRIEIEVHDDGRGFSTSALRDAAVRSRALSSEQAAAIGDEQITEMAFRPGVSTSPVITSISGHGMGLSIVRDHVERVEGRIETRSVPGVGTVIKMLVPSTIATYRGLLIEAGGIPFLCPAEAVERAIGLPRADVGKALDRGVITLGDETLPFGRLSSILGLATPMERGAERRRFPAIVLRGGDDKGVLLLDEVFGESEAIIKEFRSPLRRVRHITCAGLLGNGQLVQILRPSDLLASIHVRDEAAAAQGAPQSDTRTMRVLVVDDSITTRTMERNLFEAAGYMVRTAADGLDAWTLLQAEEVDLVVSDIDMPRMDGFELTSRIRADSRVAQLPVVLVTALESREDKERGIRVGANAYVLKSAFDQSNLLEIVGRLL